MCSAAVTRLIESTDGVESTRVDHKTGKAVVKLKPGASLDEAVLKNKIDRDFKVESCTKVAN